MSTTTEQLATIEARYRARTRGSAQLYQEACRVIPAGLTHDSRTTLPYPIYAARAAGPRKWDVDGNEYVDYFGGHGALLLGHSHPAVVEAVQRQVALGTHWGAAHELEVRWAELVQRLVPCAERVRFTASGTEASQLALRLARAYTGKPKILRFVGHFHGWHDQVAPGAMSHFDGSVPAGIPPSLVEQSILLPADDVAPAIEALERRDDIAAVIFEPSGASWGQVPLPPGFIAALRAATRRRGVLLIMDEVITGFRWSRGGAQSRYRVTPDLCVLAKILAGGLPGGAVAGSRDVMDQLDAAAAKVAQREKIGHQGTFNANPLCAAAAVATLELVAATEACAEAEATAETIRAGMRRILIEEDVPWGIYGEASTFVIFPNPGRVAIDPATFDPLQLGFKGIKGCTRREPRQSSPPRHARERRRHHGRTGWRRLRDARARRGRADARGLPDGGAVDEGRRRRPPRRRVKVPRARSRATAPSLQLALAGPARHRLVARRALRTPLQLHYLEDKRYRSDDGEQNEQFPVAFHADDAAEEQRPEERRAERHRDVALGDRLGRGLRRTIAGPKALEESHHADLLAPLVPAPGFGRRQRSRLASPRPDTPYAGRAEAPPCRR